MPARSPVEELSAIRATLRNLRVREAEILHGLRHHTPEPDPSPLPRPGWPIQRLTENRVR